MYTNKTFIVNMVIGVYEGGGSRDGGWRVALWSKSNILMSYDLFLQFVTNKHNILIIFLSIMNKQNIF